MHLEIYFTLMAPITGKQRLKICTNFESLPNIQKASIN